MTLFSVCSGLISKCFVVLLFHILRSADRIHAVIFPLVIEGLTVVNDPRAAENELISAIMQANKEPIYY